MAKVRTAEIVEHFERAIAAAGLREARVVLFGSYARGTATADSDIDIAIISPDFRGKDIFERARVTQDAELQAVRRFGLPFDIITLTPEEFAGESMAGDIVRSGMASGS